MDVPRLEDLGDLAGRRVLVRCDFNVPLSGGEITDDLRIRAALPTLRYLLDAGADLVFVDGIKSREDIENYARDMGSLPRMYNGDLANTKEMDALGYKVMICGSTIWLIYKQLKESFTELMEEGAVNPERYGTRWDVAGLLGLDDVYELEQKYGATEAPVA